MFWFIYILVSIILSLMVARMSKKYFFEIFIFSLIFFITPGKIEISYSNYAPSIFTFIFNVLFEQNFSTRILRPFLLSLPTVLFGIFLYQALKRKLS
mgnify:CR=1 FL=1